MSDVAIQRLRNEVQLSEENENSGFGQDILLICNLCERLSTECRKARDALLGEAGGSVALACLNRALAEQGQA